MDDMSTNGSTSGGLPLADVKTVVEAPVVETVEEVKNAVSEVKSDIVSVEAANGIAAKVETGVEAGVAIASTGETLGKELVALEEVLKTYGSGIVQLIKSVADKFHGIKL